LWTVARDLKIPLDNTIKEIEDIPHTVSFVVRKRQQIDNLNDLPEEKRPPELLLWDGTPEELDKWLNEVLSGKKESKVELMIKESEIEG